MQRDTGVCRVLLADDDIHTAVIVIEPLDILCAVFLGHAAIDEHGVTTELLAQCLHWCGDVAEREVDEVRPCRFECLPLCPHLTVLSKVSRRFQLERVDVLVLHHRLMEKDDLLAFLDILLNERDDLTRLDGLDEVLLLALVELLREYSIELAIGRVIVREEFEAFVNLVADTAIHENEATVIVLVYSNLASVHRAGVDEIVVELDFHRAAIHLCVRTRQLARAHPITEVLDHELVGRCADVVAAIAPRILVVVEQIALCIVDVLVMREWRSREKQDFRALLFWIGRLKVLHQLVCTRRHLQEDALHLFIEAFDFLLQGVNLRFVGRRDFLLVAIWPQDSFGFLF